MPELPEVETIVNDLKKLIVGRIIRDVWFDAPKIIRKPIPQEFKKEIAGFKIKDIERKGKNIIFRLKKQNEKKILLIHQKLTGHLLYGKWKLRENKWVPEKQGPLAEKVNNYIHLMFYFDNGQMLGLSDLRKFAKVILFDEKEFGKLEEIKKLGPDALKIDFNAFRKILENNAIKIKQLLMDQEKIAGIGNIYSDEILWASKIHPFRPANRISSAETKKIFDSIKKILKKAIKCRGASISDYRDPKGIKGEYDEIRKVYRREKQPCSRCQTPIKRIKIKSRSAHFCPKCQPERIEE